MKRAQLKYALAIRVVIVSGMSLFLVLLLGLAASTSGSRKQPNDGPAPSGSRKPVDGSLITALPTGVNLDGSAGVAILHGGQIETALTSTYTPTTTTDFAISSLASVNSANGQITSGPGTGQVTLRSAIIAANAHAGADVITFNSAVGTTYTLAVANAGGTNEDACLTGDLDVNDDLTITGNGPASTIIQAGTTSSNGIDKVIAINPTGNGPNATPTAVSFTMTDVTVQNGRNTQPFGAADFSYTGGGMDFFGVHNAPLTLTNVVFDHNTNVNGYGGGLNIDTEGPTGGAPLNSPYTGTISINDCTFSNNATQASYGGGVNLFGDAPRITMSHVTFSNNTTGNTGGAGSQGGGVNVRLTNTTGGGFVTIKENVNGGSLITGNTAFGFGGGISIGGGGNENVTIQNSTISNNTVHNNLNVAGFGGGVYAENDAVHSTTLTNDVISGNHADDTGTMGAIAAGGGLCVGAGLVTVNTGTVITNNTTAGNGGGIAVLNANATANMTGGSITNNTAKNNGGGLYVTNGGAATLSKVTITGNEANSDNASGGDGGFAYVDFNGSSVGTLTLHLSRITGNPSPTGGGGTGTTGIFNNTSGTVDAINNWWGTNSPASAMHGTVTFAPFLKLTHTASPNPILRSCTATLTASFLVKSDNTTIAASNLDVLIGLPITFSNAVLGTISLPQAAIQSSGTATATFNAGATGGNGSADAQVDNAIVTAAVTINQPPAISCPSNIIKSTDPNLCTSTASYSPTATGFPAPTTSCVPASGSTFSKGTTTVTCTAANGIHTDATCASAGTAPDPSCSFTVTVNDVQAPTINCAAVVAQTAVADASCQASVPDVRALVRAQASDNCTAQASLTITQNPMQGSTVSGAGAHNITVTVADADSNSTNCVVNFTVNDTAAPVINCAAVSAQMGAANANCQATVPDVRALVQAQASDNCTAQASLTVTQNPMQGSTVSGVGSHPITVSVADASNNSTPCVVAFSVVDNTPPTITCPSPVVHATDPNVCTAVVTYAAPSVSDNCPGVGTPSCLPASGSTFAKGVTTVTCTVMDASSNSNSCTFTVTVNDTQPPQSCIAPPANMISWWPGDGDGNDIQDGNTLTLNGTTFAAGKVGQAFSFNGSTNASAGTPANLILTGTAVTLDGWINPSVIDTNVHIYFGRSVSSGNDYCLLANFGVLTAAVKTTVGGEHFVGSSTQLPTSTWSHIALTYDGANVKLYLNGQVLASAAVTGNITNSGAAFAIGGRAGGPNFSGLIDEVEVFSRALTQAEIQGIYDAGSFGKCKPVTVSTDPGVCTAVVNYTKPMSVDACDGARTVTCSPDTGTTFSKGVTTVTCMSSDTSSNTTTTTFTVTVKDTQAPTLTCPSNINVIGNTCQNVSYTTPTGSDNCPGVGVNCLPASGACFAVGTTTVTCTATDTSGNTGQCAFTVTVTPCTITCPGNVVVPAAPGVCTAVATFADPTTTGQCGTVTCSPVSGSTFQKGVTTITCSTTAGPSCTFTVTVNDTQPPMITCPGPIVHNTDPNVCTAVVTFADPVVTDNCPPCNSGGSTKPGQSPATQAGCSVVCVPASGSTFQKGVTTVSCTATDASNNTAMCSFTVTVNDTQVPTITCPSAVIHNTDPNVCTAVVTYSNATATDNCPGVGTPVCLPASGSTFQKGVTTVSCSVSDASNNSSNCSFTVTVNDTQPPVITCPAPVIHNTDPNVCTAVVTYAAATATDNCPGVGTPSCLPASGSTFQKGVTTVSCTVSDASGNPATCSFTVTVNDMQAPSITCPTPITHNTDPNVCTAVVNFTPTATDNCPLGPTPVVCTPASGSTFQKGVTTVSCTATDTSTNTANCSFTVTVNDTQAPSITCPANISQPATAGQCSKVVTYTNATATDNCPGVGTPSCVPASGTTFQKGVTTVTCTVNDASNNQASCTFTVTITDTQPPVITCPANVVHGTDPNVCTAVVTYSNATATDNCPGVGTPVCTPASGTTFQKGVTTVSCTVSDASSNTANCTFTVTVNDTQNPSVTCPANITFTTPGFNDPCGVVTYTTPTGSDNCAVQSVVCSPASGFCFPVGMTTVTCTVTDTSNNTGQCTFKITVQNPCTITCPANITKNNDANQCGAVVTFAPTTTGGGCGTVACSPSSGSFFPKGTTTVLCTTAGPSCSFTVTVNDAQPPNITCPVNVMKSTDPDQCQAVVTYSAPVVSDNCPGVGAPICTPASGGVFPKGSTTITCTVKDSSNNMSMCSFTITVADTQPPVFPNGCPAGITKAAQVTCPFTTTLNVTYTTPVATDNCGPAPTVVCTPPSGSTFPVGTTVVTCIATDSSGNTATCTFPVNIYSFCLQDDSSDGNAAFVNALTGDYLFCKNGMPLASGKGTLVAHGCNFQIDHTKGDRKVHIQGDTSAGGGVGSGTAYIQKAGGGFVVQITDRKMTDDVCTCAPAAPPPPAASK